MKTMRENLREIETAENKKRQKHTSTFALQLNNLLFAIFQIPSGVCQQERMKHFPGYKTPD